MNLSNPMFAKSMLQLVYFTIASDNTRAIDDVYLVILLFRDNSSYISAELFLRLRKPS